MYMMNKVGCTSALIILYAFQLLGREQLLSPIRESVRYLKSIFIEFRG